MGDVGHTLLGLAVAIAVAWAALVVIMLLAARDRARVADTVRLLPDLLRLLTRLARDRTLPRGVRVRLWLLLAYLALPIDLIPDVIPVIGYADDAVVVLLVLRSVVRRCGITAVARHWPGTVDGLQAVVRLTGGEGA